MLIVYLLKGILIGFFASIPLGPMGMIVIQRSLGKSRLSGFYSGMGAALADTFYAAIAGFGVRVVIDFIIDQQIVIRIIGAFILLVMGVILFNKKPSEHLHRNHHRKKNGFWADFISVFAMTISNPLGIVVYGGIIAGFGFLDATASWENIMALLIGIFMGACSWWFTLSGIINKYRSGFRYKRLILINKITGLAILAFGLFTISSIFFMQIKKDSFAKSDAIHTGIPDRETGKDDLDISDKIVLMQ